MVTRKDLLKYKNLMVKSNYIIESSYKLSLQEQRLICILTAKINKDDIEFATYKFTHSEINNILSKHKISFNELSQHIDSLRNKELVIIKEESLLKTKWLSSAEYFKDGSIELCFDNKLKPYLLQLKERFTKVSLDKAITFNSNYSCRIYELLKQYEGIGKITISIDALRTMFCIEPYEYSRYNDFKRKVLLQAQKEINLDKTDISFDFEEIKTGRKVTSIKFYIKQNKAISEIVATLEDIKPNDKQGIYDIKLVKEIIHEQISDIEAQNILNIANGDINIIKEKYKYSETVPKIGNVVGWIIDAIKKDYKRTKGKVKIDNFNNYKQRMYDLEKKLLGWDI
ncbi:replication initiation protein [Clostridium sp. FP2]|uniref:replication initiation protein n=1 Tax=Clostridium TaxID=1485 RepID=UPI0013E97614|nr:MULTISPECIES: replication initiation protein [Clostridium]MBW9159001.1 replication initiation protein [Clostridium tagluense]MBZ9626062.1 replication initiation protein [Clostridium sp. FP2]WLC68390.1 replication initiation protein [Clostridium tagluense]